MRAFLAAAVLLLAGCGGFGGGESNVEPMAELAEFQATTRIETAWSHDVGEGRRYLSLSPWSDGGAVYVTDSDGRVTAYTVDKGRRLWRRDLDVPVSGGLGGNDKIVLLGTKKGEVIALDRGNGTVLWRAKVSSEVLAPPAVSGGVVAVNTGDGKVFALSARDGQRLWQQERTEPSLSLRGTSTPAIVDGVVVSGFANGRLAAFDVKDGRQRWELAVAEPHGRNEIERLVDVDVQPLVSGNTLYTAAYQGRMIAVNVESGSVAWSRELSAHTGLDRDNAHLYITDASGNVLAVDPQTGGGLWKQDKLRGRGLTAPAVVGPFVVVGDVEGYVHFLRREDGAFAARYRLERALNEGALGNEETWTPIRAKPVVVGDTVFVLNTGGQLVALRAR